MQPQYLHIARRHPARSRVALRLVAVSMTVGALSACGSLSGFGGGTSLTCHLPTGAHCDSVSNTYGDSLRGELPGQQRNNNQAPAAPAARSGLQGSTGPAAGQGRDPNITNVAIAPPTAGSMPLRSQSRVMRIWIKAWEDSDGDLHDQSFVYIPVDESRWMVEHKQRQVREAYAPMRSLRSVSAGLGDAPAATVTGAPLPAVPATVSLNERDAAQKTQVQGPRRGY